MAELAVPEAAELDDTVVDAEIVSDDQGKRSEEHTSELQSP